MPSRDHNFYEALGRRIALARGSANLTQAQLGQLVELSRASVTNIEVGRQFVQVHVLVKIANELSVSVAHLLPDRADDGARGVVSKLDALDADRRVWIEKIIKKVDSNDA